MNSIEDEYHGALNHVPLIKWQFIDVFRDKFIFRDANSSEHRLLPEGATTFNSRECVDGYEDEDTLHRSRYNAQRQGLGVIFIPCLHIESEERLAIPIS